MDLRCKHSAFMKFTFDDFILNSPRFDSICLIFLTLGSSSLCWEYYIFCILQRQEKTWKKKLGEEKLRQTIYWGACVRNSQRKALRKRKKKWSRMFVHYMNWALKNSLKIHSGFKKAFLCLHHICFNLIYDAEKNIN